MRHSNDPRPSEEEELLTKAVTLGLFGLDNLDAPLPATSPRYELAGLLGEGGFGSVYLAWDRDLHRHVALKYLTYARAADVERFRREARYTARLLSPSIVQVYEIGHVEGHHFMAMQYVDGEDLRRAEPSRDELVRIIRDIALALEHAHAHGIVHRDIKPENILLSKERQAFITDFGIARDLHASGVQGLSQDGMILGTPSLMPPEQARGETHAVDARSDVYALGATLYWKLARRPPFQAGSLVQLLNEVIHEQPPLLRALDASIPRSLEAVAMKCLRKAKSDRYSGMGPLAEDLDRILSGRPVASEGTLWFGRLVGVPPRPLPDPSDSDPDWRVGSEIVQEISTWDADRYRVSGNICRTYPRLERVVERLESLLNRQPDLAWARFYRGVALLRMHRLAEALEDMESTIDRVGNLANAHFELGRLYLALHLKDLKGAHRHLVRRGVEDALASSRVRLEQAILALREAQSRRSDSPLWQLRFADAVSFLGQEDFAACVLVCDEILALDPDVEEVWKLRGDALHLVGDDPFASYDRALAIRRSYYEALHAKAECHWERGEVDEAIQAVTHSLQICPDSADGMALYARILAGRSWDEASAEALEQALEVTAQALAITPSHFDCALLRAELLIERGARGKNLEDFDAADEILASPAREGGCQNRVAYLRARAQLARGLALRARGGPHREILAGVLALRKTQCPDAFSGPQWALVFANAERALGESAAEPPRAP